GAGARRLYPHDLRPAGPSRPRARPDEPARAHRARRALYGLRPLGRPDWQDARGLLAGRARDQDDADQGLRPDRALDRAGRRRPRRRDLLPRGSGARPGLSSLSPPPRPAEQRFGRGEGARRWPKRALRPTVALGSRPDYVERYGSD